MTALEGPYFLEITKQKAHEKISKYLKFAIEIPGREKKNMVKKKKNILWEIVTITVSFLLKDINIQIQKCHQNQNRYT